MALNNKFKRHTEEDARQALEERAAELNSGESRVRLKDGLNVLWVLPKVDTMVEPYLFKYVHYNPFHICGRTDPSPDPKDSNKLLEDRNFKNCIRDITAWKRYEAAGKPKEGPDHAAFKKDMPAVQCLVQVVNLSPFFKLDSSKEFATPDKALMKEFGEAFVEVMKGGDAPEGMPDEMVEAAKAGVTILLLNQDTGKALRKEHTRACIILEEDPLFMPDEYLVQIIRKDGTKTFEVGGKTRKNKDNLVSFTEPKKMKDWKMFDGLIDVAADLAVDVNAIAAKSEALADRAQALEVFNPEDMLAYLAQSGHSFDPVGDESESSSGSSSAPTSPDDFEDDEDVLPASGKKDLAALRKQLQNDED